MTRRGVTPITDPRGNPEDDYRNAIRQMRHEVWRADEGLNTATEALLRIAVIALEAMGEGPHA